ncbi:hypothetical protein Tco_1344900 [Tanacetum coccineum]
MHEFFGLLFPTQALHQIQDETKELLFLNWKLSKKIYQICPNLPTKKFEDPPFEEEILAFIRKLGYSRNIKSLSDVKVETLPQPWRTFGTIINKCLIGKVNALDLHQYSPDLQIIMKKKNKDMYYPRFTKVIINHFMSKDQSIPRRNKVDWHMANNDPILTIMRFIPKHETVQKYGAILPDTLTNQAMKESDAYKIYHDFATGKFSTHDEEERQEEDKEEEGSDLRVQTPSHFESTNDEAYDEFEDRVKGLEDDFLEFKQTNQFAKVVSLIPGIVDTYLANKMNKAVKTDVQLQSDILRNEAQAKNEDFINKLDENIKKIIKEQVKVQVKEQVTKILPKIKKRPLYKALVDAYETDKDILETYGDTVTFKIHQDYKDEDEEPSARSNRGSKRRRAGKEPESTSAPKEKTSKSTGKSKEGSKSHQTSTGKSAQAEEPIHADEDL